MKKVTKVLTRILLTLLCIALVIWIGAFCWSKVYYHDFYKDADRSIAIPGLGDGFVPQGLDRLEESNAFVISGYMKQNDQASRIYVIEEDGNRICTELLDEKGQAYTGHCGGVAINGDHVYISSEGELSVFATADILAGGQAKQQGSIPIGERVSFCSFQNGYLLTGAFYYAGHYDTPEHHHVTTPAGDENPALIWVFKADENGTFGIDPKPVAALSVREKVQGITVCEDGKVLLSTSWGMSSSELWLYEPDTRMGTVEGKNVPLYYLDSANLVETVVAPPMSEEPLWLDGKVYVLTESACTKYIFGNLIDGRHLFAYSF